MKSVLLERPLEEKHIDKVLEQCMFLSQRSTEHAHQAGHPDGDRTRGVEIGAAWVVQEGKHSCEIVMWAET